MKPSLVQILSSPGFSDQSPTEQAFIWILDLLGSEEETWARINHRGWSALVSNSLRGYWALNCVFLQLSIRPNKNQSVSTRIWKLNNLLRNRKVASKSRYSFFLLNRKFHPPEFWMKWKIFTGLILSSMPDLWRYEVLWPARQDTLQTRQGDNSFCEFQGWKTPHQHCFLHL